MAESSNVPSPESLVPQFSPENKMSGSTPRCQETENLASNPCNLCELNISPNVPHHSFNVTVKFVSPGASSGPFCRICHEGDNVEDLVSLCRCAVKFKIVNHLGSVGLVHLTCMERWLSTRRLPDGNDKCEICNYSFDTVRSPRSIMEWYQSEQTSNRRNVLGDVGCFAMITPLTVFSTFLCFEGARQHVMWDKSLEAGALMALATFLITVYFIWNILAIRYHLRSYFKWRSVNQTVKLVRFRRRSSTVVPANQQRNVVIRTDNIETGDSLRGLVSNSQQTSPQLPSEVNGANTQTANVCLTNA